MTKHHSRRGKDELRQLAHPTRPPRMEGKVKEAMMQPKRKPKRARARPPLSHKPQGYGPKTRKEYQLKSKRPPSK